MHGEDIVYSAKLHWIIFKWPILWLIVAVWISSAQEGYAASFFFGLAFLTAILSLIKYHTSEFAVTNKRVIIKVGFIRREVLEILLGKVESIKVDQGILGRFLGYGTIAVIGSGSSKNVFHKISKPFVFRMKVLEQIG